MSANLDAAPPPKYTVSTTTPAEPRSHNDYTIGWICALSKELTAARAMLEHIHPRLPKPPTDANTYVLGSIGEHNIVIACLPEGLTGTNQAATVATRLVSTFPAVKVGFMVGIGGGIPSKVRLGDVVVSRPTGQYPGVVQWDFGKAEKGSKFRRTGALNKPPTALLAALASLRSEHDLHGNKIHLYLDEVQRRYPNLESTYARPNPFEDPLSRPHNPSSDGGGWGIRLAALWRTIFALLGYTIGLWAIGPVTKRAEPGGRATASASNSTGQNYKKVNRKSVHYGLIASGNQVIKDEVFRDSLNESLGGDVLCIEMEAAGLMDDFPCIVIRGICDYADSDKNDDWQEYAAGVAAAYTKDFLMHLQPIEVQKEPPIKDILLRRVHDRVAKITSRLEREEDLRILEWLTPIDHSLQHNDIVHKRQIGTGQWLLGSDEYQHWLSEQKRILFCPGIPGAGKTFLTSVVVDHLSWFSSNNSATGIAYIYCNFKRKDEQTISNMLASLLKQLARRYSSLPKIIKEMYDRHTHKGNNARPQRDEIFDALRSMVAMFSRVFIVIDALDECQISDNCRHQLLLALLRLHTECEINIFATSRHIRDISERFELNHSTAILEILADDEDLRNFLDGQIMQSNRPLLRQHCVEVRNKIAKAVGGMFLLARLHFESIKFKTSYRDLKTALGALATGETAYKVAYDEAMERINNQNPDFRRLASQVLLWIVCAKRPLTKRELQHALAVEPEADQPELDKDNIPDLRDIVSVCAGLVAIDEESNIVRLIHFTTQEYFNQTRNTWFPDAQKYIATVCVTCLSYETFYTGFKETAKDFAAKIQSNALYIYAAQNWGHHIRESSNGTASLQEQSLLKNKIAISACSQLIDQTASDHHRIRRLIADIETFSGASSPPLPPTGMTGLHIATYFGLLDHTELLLHEGFDLESRDADIRQTPLSLAARKGHVAVVELLLRKGADQEAGNIIGLRPLLLAAEAGHAAIVELLLRAGADQEAGNLRGYTPLLAAVKSGHIAVVEALLPSGADQEARDNGSRTPLLVAAEAGSIAIVKLLLCRGADQEARDYRAKTPLLVAAEAGNTAIVKLLLCRGADQEARDNSARTPLLAAAEAGHIAIVELLLQGGADLEARDEYRGFTPLSWAVKRGHTAIVELLLRRGADLNIRGDDDRTPLLLAAQKGCQDEGVTPLIWAIFGGHTAVVELLLRKGADREAVDKNAGQPPLSWAAAVGHTAVVELLLRKGANREATGIQFGRTALSWAAENGNIAIVELLLREGADRDAKDGAGRTPLSWATEMNHTAVVELLRTGPEPITNS
ncbi:ankyrin repeat [Drechslerella dactyloides]|uniref:Ankyrin repeat n=1 Tax=Drechslerella dactyloides TaxID=74499 RepID=A0AAD6J5N1_DREDA|nr:ankyrin repeat [Drechslerella dactyloides]